MLLFVYRSFKAVSQRASRTSADFQLVPGIHECCPVVSGNSISKW